MLALLLMMTATAEDLWPAGGLPLEFWVSGSPFGVDYDDEVGEIANAWAEWDDAVPCLDLEAEYAGRITGDPAQDGLNAYIFDDPNNAMPDGVISSTEHWPAEADAESPTEKDVTFNDGIQWVTEAQIAGGECFEAWSLHYYLQEAIGAQLDPTRELQPDVGPGQCQTGTGFISDQQVERVIAARQLNDVGADWSCSHELLPGNPDTQAVGLVPFTLQCNTAVQGDSDRLLATTWSFGDGGTGTGLQPDHEYTTTGTYSVEACHTWQTASCGEITRCSTRDQYVIACDTTPALFRVEHDHALTWTLLNDTDLGNGYGCISAAQWDVFDEAGALVWTSPIWEPSVTFPEKGTYRVVLNIGGYAGASASELTIQVGKNGAAGCNSSGTPAPFWVSALVLLLFRRKSV